MPKPNHPCLACVARLDGGLLQRRSYLFGHSLRIRNIVTCPTCTLDQVDHLPNARAIDGYYLELESQDILAGLSPEEIAKHGRPERLDPILEFIVDHTNLETDDTINFLDLGAGNGRLITAVRTHTSWTPQAIEPDAIKCRTMAAFGIAATCGVFSDHYQGYPVAHFGLVTLTSVLEHLADPRETVARVRDILAPGGLCWIDVPNCPPDYYKTRLTDSTPHLTFWTAESLRSFASREGFEILVCGSFGNPIPRRIALTARLKRDVANRVYAYFPRPLRRVINRTRRPSLPAEVSSGRVLAPEELGKVTDFELHVDDWSRVKLFALLSKP